MLEQAQPNSSVTMMKENEAGLDILHQLLLTGERGVAILLESGDFEVKTQILKIVLDTAR
jgi:hypothetical protein